MPASHESEGFWDFSVRTYRTDGVPDACLSLQNDYGADVNMLLYCCWVGACKGQFDHELFTKASEFSTLWADHVVVPLRSARTWMKQTGCDTGPVPTAACMQLREEIKSVEIAAEKMQQQVLESLVSIDQSWSDTPEQILEEVIANLNRYAAYAGIKICEDVRQKFSLIIDAAFPAWNMEDIKRTLDT
jgi:uncharacterized protein (TIGR02444 family)